MREMPIPSLRAERSNLTHTKRRKISSSFHSSLVTINISLLADDSGRSFVLCDNGIGARTLYKSRAACLAKYVIIMSAPALLKPVSVSKMTLSSSIQPSLEAAFIIEYSPETL